MTWKLPSAQTIFASLALMAKREAKKPRRAARRISHMEQQARAVAGWRKLRERRRRAALVRAAARQKAARAGRRRRAPGTLTGGIMATMEPGKWYAASDIAALSGIPGLRSSEVRATLLQGPMRHGLVERVQNPQWRPGVRVSPQQVMAGVEVEPQWLYRLTAAGEAERRSAPIT